MTSSSNRHFPNVPPPPGSKAGVSYARFIPREELGSFAAWKPGAIGPDGQGERRAQPRPENAPPPTPEEWRAKIAEGRAAGYQDGYRDGLVALENFKQSFAAQMSQQLGQMVAAFDAQLGALEQQMAQSLARSAVLLAQRVVRSELATKPEHVATLASEAVSAVLLSARQILVRVHPDDLAFVQQGAAEVLQARGARLVADPSLQRGGCIVDSDAGSIDAAIDTRWTHAAAMLGADIGWTAEPDAATATAAAATTTSDTP
jgi:flagellar assembly protein FliH